MKKKNPFYQLFKPLERFAFSTQSVQSLPIVIGLTIIIFIPFTPKFTPLHSTSPSIFAQELETLVISNFPLFVSLLISSLLLIWGSFIFVYTKVFGVNLKAKVQIKKKYISIIESFFISPLYFLSNLYLSNLTDKYRNWIDIYFSMMMVMFYFTLLRVFHRYVEKVELITFKDVEREKLIVISMLISNIIFSSLAYMIAAQCESNIFKYVVCSKCLFTIAKIIEIFVMRSQKYYYLLRTLEKKEKVIIQNLKNKIYFEVITKLMIIHYFSMINIYATNYILFFINFIITGSQFYVSLRKYVVYENKKGLYRSVLEICKKNEKKIGEVCAMCGSGILNRGFKLRCGHQSHAICIIKALKRKGGYLSNICKCGKCQKILTFDEDDFRLNYKIVSMFSTNNNNSLRHSDENIINQQYCFNIFGHRIGFDIKYNRFSDIL